MTDGNGHPDMDYKAHNSTYSGFLGLLKWGTILTAIVTIIAVLAVA